MADSKETFVEFPDITIVWGPHGRFTIKRKGSKHPVGFIAPRNFLWQIQTHNLESVGEPFSKKEEALQASAKHFSKI